MANVTNSSGRAAVRPEPAAPVLQPLKSLRLLDQVRERIRLLHYSRRTEEAYVHWVRAFVRFHGIRHPKEMGGAEVEAFLAWLAGERQVSASTHRQALSALVFLYAKVLQHQLPWLAEIGKPRVQRRLPVVLTKEELAPIFRALDGEHKLFAQLLYGTGMRISEGLQLRVKDIDFAHRAVIVREGKGGKDRVLMLPQSLEPLLKIQLAHAHALWAADQAAQKGGVEMPHALERKYPRAGSSWPSVRWPLRASPSRQRRIPFAMPSPRTCCSPATTSAPCRICSATRMCRR
ncbi:MAG: integron integrase, partial [Comamonadaceae bacterium]